MAIPSITRSKFRTDVLRMVKGNPDNTGTTVIDGLINQAVRDVLSEVDPRSTKRRMQLTLSGANDNRYDETDGFYDLPGVITTGGAQDNQYEYHCPIDLKGDRIADVRHRTDYTPEMRLTTEDEFHRRKTVEANLVAISSNSWERKLLLAKGPQINSAQISNMDVSTGWSAVGTATTIATETSQFVEGNGAVSFTSGTGNTTSGIVKSILTAVDLSSYFETSDIFVWVYIPSATDVASFTLRWGSGASAYYERTVVNTHDLLAFYAGWNLLRFPWDDNVTQTGSPDKTAITYVSFFHTKQVATASSAGWIVDNIVARINPETDVVYYTKYGWQTSAGVYKEESDDDGDFLNADTEEYQMFVERAREYVSGKMGNDNDEKKFFDRAQNRIALYKSTTPSEAMPIENSYYYFETGPEAHDRTL